MGNNIVKIKSFAFAIRIIKLYQFLCNNKKEFVISRQLLKCGTSVGALIRESEYAESRSDFVHKLHIAQKEINESIYWIELLEATNFLVTDQFESINNDAIEILKLLTSIIKSSKRVSPKAINN